jgi:tungstate transport system substrate-binding protein
VIVGPKNDPAGVKSIKSVASAFSAIASKGATFISRGDDSGTNKKELALWKEARVNPAGKNWYINAGQGMGEVLTIASEKQGYTLTDRATFMFMKDSLNLEILSEGDRLLINPYSVIVVNPKKFPKLKLNTDAAGDFVWFITGKEGQKLIGEYRKNGFQLFHPCAKRQERGLGLLH